MDTDAILAEIKRVADTIIRPRFRALAEDEVDEKKPGDYVTIADRESEVELTRVLSAAYPDALIVGEEAVHADGSIREALVGAAHAFVVDPVDGTRNFVRGLDDYAVMVAEIVAGDIVRGWIWQPEHGRAYVAERGAGVTCNGAPVRRAAAHRPVGSSSLKKVIALAAPQLGGPISPTRWCCGIDYPRLLTGEIDFLVYGAPKPWDHVPGALMVRELGGVVRTTDGREYAPTSDGPALIVASDEAVFAAVDEALGDRVRR